MSMIHRCDRCGETSDNFAESELPDGWREMTVPVRGSEGARSLGTATICGVCDDSLYRWLRTGSPIHGGASGSGDKV